LFQNARNPHSGCLPFARRLVRRIGGFVYHFRGRFPEISQQNGKYDGMLLILLM
jgi:hypothetical protein